MLTYGKNRGRFEDNHTGTIHAWIGNQKIIYFMSATIRSILVLLAVKSFSTKTKSTKLMTLFDPNIISKNINFNFTEKIVKVRLRNGGFMYVDINDHIGYRIFMNGEYDATCYLLAKKLKLGSNDFVLDIGSHIGSVTLPLATAFDVPVIAIEGNSRNASLCLLNFHINYKKILLHYCVVLSSELIARNSWINLYSPSGNSGGTSISEFFHKTN